MNRPTTNFNAETRRRGGNRFIAPSGHRVIGALAVPARKVVLVIRATLREIFDESGYERFLTRTRSSRSVASYREFMNERATIIASKPRCC
jgi:hypothetical protein